MYTQGPYHPRTTRGPALFERTCSTSPEGPVAVNSESSVKGTPEDEAKHKWVCVFVF